MSVPKPKNPDYEKNKHFGHILIYLRKKFRRAGIGNSLIRFLAKEAKDQMKEFEGEKVTFVTKEKNGKLSSITDIGYFSNRNPKKIDQFITGVRKADLGRGLAKWVKTSMIFYIKENFPDVEYISTGMVDHNVPMLHINEKMGFKRHISDRNYKMKIEELILH